MAARLNGQRHYLWWQQLGHKSQRGEMERNYKDDGSSTAGQLGDNSSGPEVQS